MGRSLNKQYFGNNNIGRHFRLDNFIGGEGFWDVAIINSGTNYTGTNMSWIADLPHLPSGWKAYGTAEISGGTITEIKIVEPGTGYINTFTISLNLPSTTGTTATYAISLRNIVDNAVEIYAIPPLNTTGTTNVYPVPLPADVVKQHSDRRFYIKTWSGQGLCSLTTGTITQGTMSIIAVDANYNTYWVTKFYSHKVQLYRKAASGAGAFVYQTGDFAKWSFNAANGTDKSLSTTLVRVASY